MEKQELWSTPIRGVSKDIDNDWVIQTVNGQVLVPKGKMSGYPSRGNMLTHYDDGSYDAY